MKKQKFDVSGMSCAACSAHVNKAVEKLDGIKSVNVNLLQNSMVTEYDENVCSSEKIIAAVSAAGYGAKVSGEKEKTENIIPATTKDAAGKKLIVGAIFLIMLMYFSMGNMMWGFPSPAVFDHHHNPAGHALLQLILLLPILFIYRNYFISGFKRLFKKSPNMDSLIAVGATASVIYSLFSTFMITYGTAMLSHIATGSMPQADTETFRNMIATYSDNLYYEAAGMILTLVSLGKYLEGLSKRKTTDAVKRLMDLAPKKAVVIIDGEEKEIPTENVKVGDVVIVKNGAAVPVDGVITEGGASFDQSNITGESVPVYKTVGEEVFSSSVITAGYVKIRAVKVGEDSSIATIIKLVEEASNSKAPISRLADKISGIFVPLIFGIAAITFAINLLVQLFSVGADASAAFELAFRFSITVVVIACPCALGLATPVAIMVGTGKGAENGLLIKNAEILEKAHLIKTVVLDKTGTITEGKPKVVDFEVLSRFDKKEILSAVYSLENNSEHPLARAITDFAKEHNTPLLSVEDYAFSEGKGIKGKVNGDEYYIGNARIYEDYETDKEEVFSLSENFAAQGKTPLIVFKNGNPVGIFGVKDVIKDDSLTAVSELKRRGIEVVMLTGDNKTAAETIAKEVGVSKVIAEVFPADKQRIVESLKTDKKHLVAMVGDGVNDAPALTSADLGIAIGGGSDVAMDAGDIVLLRKSLTDVINVIDLSKRVLNTIKLSLFWAFFYNFVCVFIATGALYYIPAINFGIKPEYGSVAMSISSVSVVLTALTINFFKPKQNAAITTEKETDVFTLKVKGMMCEHCKARVEKAALSTQGVLKADADYKKGMLSVAADKTFDPKKLKENVLAAGYKVK